MGYVILIPLVIISVSAHVLAVLYKVVTISEVNISAPNHMSAESISRFSFEAPVIFKAFLHIFHNAFLVSINNL